MFPKKYSKIIIGILLIFGFLLTLQAAGAVDLQVKIPGQPDAGKDLAHYVAAWYTFGVSAISIIAVVMIMWGGFEWITAAGNATLIGQAKGRIMNAIVGIILVLTSYGLLYLINPALVELRMPVIEKITNQPIPQPKAEEDKNNVLAKIGKSCSSNIDCQGTSLNPIYDLMCYFSCKNPQNTLGEVRKCVYVKDWIKNSCGTSNENLCVNYNEVCTIKSEEDVSGNCCDKRLACNFRCKEKGGTGDYCTRNADCKKGLTCKGQVFKQCEGVDQKTGSW